MRNGVTLLLLVAVGVLAALALADAFRPSGHSSAPLTVAPTSTEAPTVKIVRPPNLAAPPRPRLPRRFCGSLRVAPPGDHPLLLVEVVSGDASCEEARQVMKAHYVGGDRGAWSCHGPEGDAGCGKGPDDELRAYFSSLPSPAQDAERVALRWARGFAAHLRSCPHMTQPGCERVICERVGGFTIPNCIPLSSAYRHSFEGATVDEIARRGRLIAARFSNGELIELVGVVGSEWMVHKVGWEAGSKVFE